MSLGYLGLSGEISAGHQEILLPVMILNRILNTEKSNKGIDKIECHQQVEERLVKDDPAGAVVLRGYEAERRRAIQTDTIVHYPAKYDQNSNNSCAEDYFVDICA